MSTTRTRPAWVVAILVLGVGLVAFGAMLLVGAAMVSKGYPMDLGDTKNRSMLQEMAVYGVSTLVPGGALSVLGATLLVRKR